MNALDNTPLEYVNWQSDQPDNWHGPKGQDKEGTPLNFLGFFSWQEFLTFF